MKKVRTEKDEDKVYRVKITTRPRVTDDFLLSVPKGVEMNEEIIQNSGYCTIRHYDVVDFDIDEMDDLNFKFSIPVLDNDGNITKEGDTKWEDRINPF